MSTTATAGLSRRRGSRHRHRRRIASCSLTMVKDQVALDGWLREAEASALCCSPPRDEDAVLLP